MISGYQYKDLVETILEDFEMNVLQLCQRNQRKTGRYEFTSQQMLKLAARQHQSAYVQLLERSREYFPTYIFNRVHEDLGKGIARRARLMGFEKIKMGNDEMDIFGNRTGKIVYRPKGQ